MDIVDFVQLVSAGSTIIEYHTSDATIVWVLVQLADGRRLLISERTYRPGTTVLVDPTEGEIEAARRDPWTAWNSERGEDLGGVDLRRFPRSSDASPS